MIYVTASMDVKSASQFAQYSCAATVHPQTWGAGLGLRLVFRDRIEFWVMAESFYQRVR